MMGGGGHDDCCGHLQMRPHTTATDAVRGPPGQHAESAAPPGVVSAVVGGRSGGGGKEPGDGGGGGEFDGGGAGDGRGKGGGAASALPLTDEVAHKTQEMLQEEIEREATLEAIHADRGDREGFGEREEWNDPEVQARFRAARERAAARRKRRRAAQEKDAAMAQAGGTGARRLAGVEHVHGGGAATDESARESKGQLCFVEGAVDDGGGAISLFNVSRDAGACLNARRVFVGQRARCSAHLDCIRQAGRETMCIHAAPGPPNLFLPLQVLHASAAPSSLAASFEHARGGLKGLKGAEPVLFLGTVQELYESVAITPYRPRLPIEFVARLDLPLVLSRMLAYIAAISASIAVFNLVPASGLDGEFTFQALCDMMARRGGAGAMLPLEGRAGGWGGLVVGERVAWRDRVVQGSGAMLVASLASSLVRL